MRLGGAEFGHDHSIATMSRRLFERVDENRNGQASLQEFQRSGVLRKLGVVKTSDEEKAAFEAADTNLDGSLSRIESQVFFQQMLTHSEKARIAAMLMLMQEDQAEAARAPAADSQDAEPPKADPADGPTDPVRAAEAKRVKAYDELARRTEEALASAPTHAATA